MDETFAAVYNNLNEAQRQAVDALDGPLLVIADFYRKRRSYYAQPLDAVYWPDSL
jgi:hypothetical protein